MLKDKFNIGLDNVVLSPEGMADVQRLSKSAKMAEELGQPGRAKRILEALRCFRDRLHTLDEIIAEGRWYTHLDSYQGRENLYLHTIFAPRGVNAAAFSIAWEGEDGVLSAARVAGAFDGDQFVVVAVGEDHEDVYDSARPRFEELRATART